MLRAIILEDANSSHELTVGKPVPMRNCALWHEKTAWNEHVNFIGKLEVFVSNDAVSIKFWMQISFQCALKRYCGEMFKNWYYQVLWVKCEQGIEVSWKVSRHLESLWFNCRLVTQYGGCCVAGNGSFLQTPPRRPAQVVRLTMKPARKDAGMYACVYRTPVPSRVSSDRVVPPQTIARKTLQDMTTTFPPKAGMSTVAPLGNRIGKTDPHARGSHVLCLFNSASPHLGDWIQSFHNGHVTCAKKKYGLKKLGT